MAEVTYNNITRPYSAEMLRSDQTAALGSNAGDATQNYGAKSIPSGSDFSDVWIDTWIKSTGYIPKQRGFFIDGQAGYIECMKLYVGNGGIVGGALDIPDLISANSFHVDTMGNTWWGGTTLATSTAKILNTGAGTFSNITITGGSVAGSTITTASLTGSQMQNATITATQIANATITGTQIAAATISGSNLVNATVTATQIANATITGTQIAAATITGSNLVNATITATQIANATITGTQIANATISASNITNATITATQIANAAITPVKTTLPIFVLSAGTFTNNSPTAGKVAWSGAKVVYNGTESSITNNNTSLTYIIWDNSSPTVFSGSATVPITNGIFLVGINTSGIYSSVWDVPQVNGAQIQANSITAGQITNATITGTQIANGAITSTQIANATIIATNISGTANITGSQLSSTAGILGGQIANATITGSNISNNTITVGKVSIPTHFVTATWTDNSPTATKVAWASSTMDYNGSTYSITDGNTDKKYIWWDFSLSTTTFQVSDSLPTLADADCLIAENNSGIHRLIWNATDVSGSQIQLAAITGANIANSTISGSNLVNNTITASQIANATITGSQIAATTIAGSNIVNNTITASQIANATITATQLANATITATQIANATITGTQIAAATITGSNLTNATITATQIANNTITATQIANTTITASQIANLTITASQIANLTIGNGQIGNVSIDKLTAGTLTANTMTVGAAATDGYIQSYGWNGTVNGFQIKGGATPAFTLIGGAITGSTIKTNVATYPYVNINSSGIQITGSTSLIFQAADGTGVGGIWGSDTPYALNIGSTNGNINISSNQDIVIGAGSYNILPSANGTQYLGSSSKQFRAIYAQTLNTSGINISGSLFPASNNSYDLGLYDTVWRNCFTNQVTPQLYSDLKISISTGFSLAPAAANIDLGNSSDLWRTLYLADNGTSPYPVIIGSNALSAVKLTYKDAFGANATRTFLCSGLQ